MFLFHSLPLPIDLKRMLSDIYIGNIVDFVVGNEAVPIAATVGVWQGDALRTTQVFNLAADFSSSTVREQPWNQPLRTHCQGNILRRLLSGDVIHSPITARAAARATVYYVSSHFVVSPPLLVFSHQNKSPAFSIHTPSIRPRFLTVVQTARTNYKD